MRSIVKAALVALIVLSVMSFAHSVRISVSDRR